MTYLSDFISHRRVKKKNGCIPLSCWTNGTINITLIETNSQYWVGNRVNYTYRRKLLFHILINNYCCFLNLNATFYSQMMTI